MSYAKAPRAKRLRPAILKINQNLRDTLSFALRPTPVTASLR